MNNCVSIMMVCYNRLELTKRMLASFFKNTNSEYRLIIIDNGSTDGTVDWLKELKPEGDFCQGLYLHFNFENKGIAIGRNQALLIADKFQDKWLSTVDNDIEVHYGWLNECLDILKTNHKFAIGLNMEGVNYPIQLMNGKPVQWKKEGNLGTACTVFHRKLHEAIGFFNTDFGLYSHEDASFFNRARLAGWQLGYLPTNGVHFGIDELDTGAYRDFKTKSAKDNLPAYRQAHFDYLSGKKSIYIPYTEKL